MSGANLWIALVSVAVGALLGGVVQACARRYEAFAESKGIAAALAAEVTAVVGFARQRDYVTLLREVIARLENPDHIPTVRDCLAVKITQDYFSVFHALAPKIGALGLLAREVVTLYTRAKGIIEDMASLHQLNEAALDNDLRPAGAPRFTLDRVGLLAMNKELCALLESVTLRDGPALIHRLEAYSERRWWGMFP